MFGKPSCLELARACRADCWWEAEISTSLVDGGGQIPGGHRNPVSRESSEHPTPVLLSVQARVVRGRKCGWLSILFLGINQLKGDSNA
jgi:hypothetical protein